MKKRVIFVLFALSSLIVVLLASGGASLFDFGRADANAPGASEQVALVAGSEEAFEYLSRQRTNACSLQREVVLTYPADARIQGSCCAPMDLHRYQEQVQALRQYADIAQIPTDPYDIPAPLAQDLLRYQADIQLTFLQQALYDEAMTLSDEGGPCCCRCWRWDAFEGLGKYLITQRRWSAQQLADLWSLTDGCGGAGHQHG